MSNFDPGANWRSTPTNVDGPEFKYAPPPTNWGEVAFWCAAAAISAPMIIAFPMLFVLVGIGMLLACNCK